MKFTAQQIAAQLEGTVDGDPNVEVFQLSKIEEAQKGSLTFLANPKYKQYIYKTQASITIVNDDFVAENDLSTTLVRVPNAYDSFTLLLDYYNKVKTSKTGISEKAIIDPSVKMGNDCFVGHFTCVGEGTEMGDKVKIFDQCHLGSNVTIGEGTIIFAGAKILDDTIIGANCIIHSGTVIGSDGFGFAPQDGGGYKKIPQTGIVVIGDDVEIGANSTIDRATLGVTSIANGVKLDNQIQIAHNVEIGENTVIAAQTGVAGSSKIGKNCVIGGQVGIIGHITIGDNVKIQGQSGVNTSIKDDMKIQGTPAFSYNDYNKSYVYFKNLPNLGREINSILKKLNL
ncbi:MAG: UDP-3-O-(3-hydroxymyristoyl)glucosamine N-acyltransferase [Flavobacteriales bacterium MED-G15]|nr:MAG: UDP-3-O-(3-hydroxymyristoyl)glucosamine N-acyltransferase [Flavobacteriales bacterium MED-G15]